MERVVSPPVREVAGIEVEMTFAPVRQLSDGALAAVELQLHGPVGSALHSAQELRRASRLLDQKSDLDLVKAERAAGAAAELLSQSVAVLVTLDAFHLDASLAAHPSATPRRVIVTVSAQMFINEPHHTMVAIGAARERGYAICLEVSDADLHALAFMSLIEPDIIVTTPELLRNSLAADAAQITQAITAHIERSHAVVIAEGVDDEAARATARTMGATYGIGNLYPPLPLEELAAEEIVPIPPHPVWVSPESDEDTPYAIATRDAPPRLGTKHLLVEMSKALESQAASIGTSMIAIGTFQQEKHYTDKTSARWRSLSETVGFAGVYGVGIDAVREGNVHKAPLAPDDPLVDEWTIAILGPHFSALITARDRHDNGPDMERTFDFVQSFDRLTVVQAVRTILDRSSQGY